MKDEHEPQPFIPERLYVRFAADEIDLRVRFWDHKKPEDMEAKTEYIRKDKYDNLLEAGKRLSKLAEEILIRGMSDQEVKLMQAAYKKLDNAIYEAEGTLS